MPLTNVRDKPLHKLKVENKQSLRSSQAAGLGKWRIETLNSPASPAKRGEQLSTLNSNGFSLIEVLLSFFFIATLLTMVLTTSGSLFTRKRSDQNTIAARIAAKKIEELRGKDFTEVQQPVISCTGPSTTNFTDPDTSKLKGPVTAQYTISCFSEGGGPLTNTFLNAKVEITYYTDNGPQQNYTTQTLLYQYGL